MHHWFVFVLYQIKNTLDWTHNDCKVDYWLGRTIKVEVVVVVSQLRPTNQVTQVILSIDNASLSTFSAGTWPITIDYSWHWHLRVTHRISYVIEQTMHYCLVCRLIVSNRVLRNQAIVGGRSGYTTPFTSAWEYIQAKSARLMQYGD